MPAQVLIDGERELPKLLDKGWLFAEGLNPDWLARDFNGSGMAPIESLGEVTNLPVLQPDKAYTLFIRFSLKGVTKSPLSLCIEQAGSTRIYLDGLLLQTYGNFDTRPIAVKAYNPQNRPLELPKLDAGLHTLVVQYVFQKGLNLRPMINTTFPLFRAQVMERDDAIMLFADRHGVALDFFKIGLTMMLFLIHFIGYIFYPAARVQLFFSLYAFFACIGFFLLYSQHQTYDLADKITLNKFFMLVAGLSNFSLIAVLSILLAPVRKVWLGILLLATFADPLNTLFANEPYRSSLAILFGMISPVTLAWLSYQGKVKGVAAARYLFWGAVVFFILWMLFLLSYQVQTSSIVQDILFHCAAFTFSICISMILSQNFRFINIDLEKKIREVHILSQEKHNILEKQNEELEIKVQDRTAALTRSLDELQQAQAQLIQSEKMASLGELTAGIAHEIQNPLNFVNNFSEVSKELLEEMKMELDSGHYIDARAISDDVIQNLEKISHHGKRADAIVKGMLQHSPASAAEKEPTNINTLADEYLRLSYHGLRAKDKSFNSILKTDFDPLIEKINIIPQDIGRVLLNLFNNAFYAVSEKKKQTESGQILTPGYEPVVAISTKKTNGMVVISVSDNGNGIPQKLIGKIFQPFFTTKPTGQGTGLGLSLSFDIIKAHGGEIKVDTKEGEGSAFVIVIPVFS